MNQLVNKKIKKDVWRYEYDGRGNRVHDTGKQLDTRYTFDATGMMVQGRTQKGATSSYTYNGLNVRVNNTQVSHSGKRVSVDYVNDYTSVGFDELMLYSRGQGQDSFDQRMVYGGGQRVGQLTDRAPGNNGGGGRERMLYVHEDVSGSVQFFSKENGKNFAQLEYDPYGMPDSPSKLLNNNNGNYVAARYTNHEFDTVLDIYFANARMYDANNRQWLSRDPVKDGLNWYQYTASLDRSGV